MSILKPVVFPHLLQGYFSPTGDRNSPRHRHVLIKEIPTKFGIISLENNNTQASSRLQIPSLSSFNSRLHCLKCTEQTAALPSFYYYEEILALELGVGVS